MNQPHMIAIILLGLIIGTNAFSYKDAGNWGKKYPKCDGQHQSPISFDPIGKDILRIKDQIKLTDFDKSPKKMTMKNTGHTVEMRAEWDKKPPRCAGGPLHGNYVFEKATFHWAPKKWAEELARDDPNKEFAMQYTMEMEMHVFFYNTDFESFEKAETEKGGLAVLNMGIQTGNDNPEHMLDNLAKNLHKIRSPNTTAEIKPFPLLHYLDYGYTPFIFYDGYLDYPPCWESVTWVIAAAGISVSDSLLSEFKRIKLVEGDVSNVRPFQPRNKRQVGYVENFILPTV